MGNVLRKWEGGFSSSGKCIEEVGGRIFLAVGKCIEEVGGRIF